MTPAITPDPQAPLQAEAPPEQEAAAPNYGEDNRNLPPELVKAIKALTEKFQGQDKYARRSEVVEARRQRFYDRGDQYIYWNATSFVFVPVTGGGGLQVGSDSVDMPRYTDVYNIYHPFGRSIVAVLSQNPPGVNFEPDDPTKSTDITAAQGAEKYKWVVDRANDRKSLQQKIARLFWTDGRVCLYTRTVTQPDGNKQQIIDAYGVLEHKCPIIAGSQEQMPYQVLSDEIDICKAKDDCPWAAAQIKEGDSAMGESSYERMARLGVLQGTRLLMQAGDAYAHIVTRHHVFLRPAAFQEAPKEVQEQLKEAFPDGCHVMFAGGAYCGSWNESMDDHLAIGHAEDGDGQSRPSWGKGMVPLQDAYNNYKNMRREYHDYGIPMMIMDQSMFDVDAMREQISEPGNTIFTTQSTNGQPLTNFYGQTEALTPPEDLIEAENDLRGPLGEFISAAQPSLFGAQLKGNDTAAAYAMSREQAMGIIGTPWGRMQELFAKCYKQAVMCAAKDEAADAVVNISIPGKRGMEKLDSVAIADLQVGNFHCFPDTDSSFPETWSAKRSAFQTFMQAAEFNPVLMEASTEPDNLALGKELSGLEELVIPGVEARNKQLREIEELLANVPQPPSQEAMMQFAHLSAMYKTAVQAGMQETQAPPQPPPPQSSVPVDPIYDFHKYEFQEVQAWLNSEERVEEEKKGNLKGIENVRLHGIEHQQAMLAQMPPPMPAPAPAPQGGAPKPAAPKKPNAAPSPGQPAAQPVM